VSDHITHIAKAIRDEIPIADLPAGDHLGLFRIYAVLACAKGTATTAEDVHDAWCAWMGQIDAAHPALVPFDQLDPVAQGRDAPFVVAIAKVAHSLS
jgi:hypothetical protein